MIVNAAVNSTGASAVDDLDSPWKEALDHYLEQAMALLFPVAHGDIDWRRGYESLDKELQAIVRESEQGKRLVDTLVKVWRRDGQEEWVLIHLEVQSQEESEFARRMFVYNYRVFDRYNRTVVSLAVLGDERPSWRPDQFGYSLWGCDVGIHFPVVKLLDLAQDLAALEASANPFAVLVLAHLKSQATKKNPADRRAWKMRLVRGLFERGLQGEEIRRLFKYIDWMMTLPRELEDSFWQEVHDYEQEKRMPYITSVERIGMEKGLNQGRQEVYLEAIEFALDLKFGDQGLSLLPEIKAITDVERLRTVLHALKKVKTLDEARALLS